MYCLDDGSVLTKLSETVQECPVCFRRGHIDPAVGDASALRQSVFCKFCGKEMCHLRGDVLECPSCKYRMVWSALALDICCDLEAEPKKWIIDMRLVVSERQSGIHALDVLPGGGLVGICGGRIFWHVGKRTQWADDESIGRVQDVACDKAGNVYAADPSNDCVHYFRSSARRRPSESISSRLGRPLHVCVDSLGLLHVADGFGGEYQVWVNGANRDYDVHTREIREIDDMLLSSLSRGEDVLVLSQEKLFCYARGPRKKTLIWESQGLCESDNCVGIIALAANPCADLLVGAGAAERKMVFFSGVGIAVASIATDFVPRCIAFDVTGRVLYVGDAEDPIVHVFKRIEPFLKEADVMRAPRKQNGRKMAGGNV